MIEAIGAIIAILGLWLFLCDKQNEFAMPLLVVGAVCLGISAAIAQHVHPDETITDPKVAKFYETWTRPPQRSVSCCNMKDCYAAQIRRGPNGLEYLHKWSGSWAKLPSHLIEHNQADPRESPNTENHVCASELYPDIVYCAVLSAGI